MHGFKQNLISAYDFFSKWLWVPRYKILTVDRRQLYEIWDCRCACRFYMRAADIVRLPFILRRLSRQDRRYILGIANHAHPLNPSLESP